MNLSNVILDFELQLKAASVFIWEPPEFLVSLLLRVPVNLSKTRCSQQNITKPVLFILTSCYFQGVFDSSLNISVSQKLSYVQITWQMALCFSCLYFLSLLSTPQLAYPRLHNAVLSSTVRHSHLFSSVTLSPIFPCFSPGCFQSLAFPFHFSKPSLHTVTSDNFCPCLLLSSDSISLPMHWFCPLAYPKLIPLKCSLCCPL